MKVRKKPLVLDAWQLNIEEIESSLREDGPAAAWVVNSYKDGKLSFIRVEEIGYWSIDTLEGRMVAYDGDYLIKGAEGELYPCKKEIFEKTYDIVDESNFEGLCASCKWEENENCPYLKKTNNPYFDGNISFCDFYKRKIAKVCTWMCDDLEKGVVYTSIPPKYFCKKWNQYVSLGFVCWEDREGEGKEKE